GGQHARAILDLGGDAHFVGPFAAALPFDGDAPHGVILEVHDVGAGLGVPGHAFAARDVADDGLAHDRVAALRAVDEQVARALDRDALFSHAEQALDRVRDGSRLLRSGRGLQLLRGDEAREDLAHRDLAVADGGVEVVPLRAHAQL